MLNRPNEHNNKVPNRMQQKQPTARDKKAGYKVRAGESKRFYGYQIFTLEFPIRMIVVMYVTNIIIIPLS